MASICSQKHVPVDSACGPTFSLSPRPSKSCSEHSIFHDGQCRKGRRPDTQRPLSTAPYSLHTADPQAVLRIRSDFRLRHLDCETKIHRGTVGNFDMTTHSPQ